MSTHVETATARADLQARPKVWSLPRLISALVLASWGALFWFLMIADRTPLFLSSRTDWVVPLGAIILTVATLGRLFSARVPRPEDMERRDVLGMAFIVVPVITVLALPPASLGTYAASRRSSLTSGSFVSSAEDIKSGELSLVDVSGAVRSEESMAALVNRAGSDVSFTGFVRRDSSMPVNEFILTRFLISCCVADALSAEVRIVGAPPGKFKNDQWVRAEGQMYPVGQEVIVDADSVVAVPKPEKPYLSP